MLGSETYDCDNFERSLFKAYCTCKAVSLHHQEVVLLCCVHSQTVRIIVACPVSFGSVFVYDLKER